jgi:stage IV sporulation protein FB
MRFENGWLHVGRWRGAAVRLHWTVPVGAVCFSGFKFAPVFWLLFPALVLVHEFGHAWMVSRVGCRAISIDAHGMGGECAWYGDPTPFQRAAIAWGGVLAQALLLVAVIVVDEVLQIPRSPFVNQARHVLYGTNTMMIVLNLLPLRPLDGAEAWPIVPMLWTRLVARLRRARRPPAPRVSIARQVHSFGKPTAGDVAEAHRLMEAVRADARAQRRSRDDADV